MESEVTCRVRVKAPFSNNEDVSLTENQPLVTLGDCPDIAIETRLQWAHEIAIKFLDCPELCDTIRPWDFILGLDGSVESIAVPPSESRHNEVYPARFRIPPDTLLGLGQEEKNKRAEAFALGGLLYEIVSLKRPFEELNDDEIQSRYRKGEFPDDIWSLPLSLTILGCWSLEFSKEVEKIGVKSPGPLQAAGNYVQEHPIRFTLQALGGVAMLASVAAVPVLGAAGFAATGPVAGSAAAAWQASIGLVEAGSLFAWCQSAAMGGAALGGVVACGAAGAGVAGAATVPVLSGMKQKFMSVFRGQANAANGS